MGHTNDVLTLWLPLIVATIPALAAIIAAVWAARSAASANKQLDEAQRIRELESRLSEIKRDTYSPMIEMLGNTFSQAKTSKEAIADADANVAKFVTFGTWIMMYGSDEAIQAWHNLTQSFGYNPPTMISMRLIADFILAARRDIGHPDTVISRTDLFAIRITDFYELSERDRQIMTVPLSEAFKLADWSPPWSFMKGTLQLESPNLPTAQEK